MIMEAARSTNNKYLNENGLQDQYQYGVRYEVSHVIAHCKLLAVTERSKLFLLRVPPHIG
jgi:hypothetical protein